MNSFATDHLRRLEHLLASAKADYDTLAYVILEGATQVTFHSHKRSITVPIGGDDLGHFSGMLAEAALARIAALEKEVVEAHALVVTEADDNQLEADQLTQFWVQARTEPLAAAAGDSS